MTKKLFIPHIDQLRAIRHILAHKRCAIWASMGSGKTVATLTALDLLNLCGDLRGLTLVIAPLRVARTTWPDEVEKWAHLADFKVQPITGKESERLRALANRKANVFTINYENVPWLVKVMGGPKWPFKTVVADESTRLKGYRKNQGTQRAKALAEVAHEQVDRFIELTGTPAPNGYLDLWGQAWFLDAGVRLGRSYTAYTQRWFQRGFDGFSYNLLAFAEKDIQGRLKDLCITLDAKKSLKVDEPIHRPVYVTLPEEAQARYREMERDMYTELENDGIDQGIEAFNAASRTMKCLQLASGAAYLPRPVGEDGKPLGPQEWVEVHDEKIQALESIIEEAAGMPVLVAYHFKSDLARLKKAFPKGRELDKDPATIKAWNQGKIPVLFAHPQSAGHGLNLQEGGNILAFFSHSWDLEQYQQIIERIGPLRQKQAGFDRPVFVYHIIARGTMDEVVMQRRETKREVQDLLLEAMRKGKE